MTLEDRLATLSDAAKYDASCSSSGSDREGEFGAAHKSGICHSWTSDGRCVSLLKILMTNFCIYDCAYCMSKSSNDIVRTSLSPEEIATLTIGFYKRNMIEGLFLSSGVVKSADHTMELLVKAVKLLRIEHRFGGYIHLKTIPGASEELIRRAGLFVDRLSVNIELPSAKSLSVLAPQKSKIDILTPMKLIAIGIDENKQERKNLPISIKKSAPLFVPAGQSTQIIVGASPESDRDLLLLSGSLYDKFDLKRVYYSAYIPVNVDSRLPVVDTPPLLREHRLYQADWLLRFYGFGVDEILEDDSPDFDPRYDPKMGWAIRHPELFPVELGRASYEMIMRIPGIGIRSAGKIVKSRRFSALSFEGLAKMGVSMKRARYFVTVGGKRQDDMDTIIKAVEKPKIAKLTHSLFDEPGANSAISGEL
jgi:putative DNA modification/repair radical SAM protein